jgi:hypothetical protein
VRGIQSAIYFKMHAAFLRNRRSEADLLLAMLEDEVAHAPGVLIGEVGPRHMERLDRIRERMSHGEYGRVYGRGSEVPDVAPRAHVEPSGVEADFHKKLIHRDGRGLFMDVIGAARGSDMVHELDMREFGRCDFVIRDGRTWHVVEIKMGQAPADVPSQIDRYRIASELDMNLGLHDDVRAAVVAEHFPQYVATELSRLAVSMILHDGTPAGLRVLSMG